MTEQAELEARTGALFGPLWGALTDEQYRDSVSLFDRRFAGNGFDLSWFNGKRCLDVGTGSGRYALAMALHGAAVTGCDISREGLATACERTKPFAPIKFVHGSALDLPFPDQAFDFVCCAGVLHHTPSIERGLDEIARVLRPGGKVFLLLYGAGGFRWKLIAALRPIAAELGRDVLAAAIDRAALPANNRKHFMDDLLVPIQTLTAWTDLHRSLTAGGFGHIERWAKERLDHEASPALQLADMEKLALIFDRAEGPLGHIGSEIARTFCEAARRHSDDEALIIGEGNHRVLATRN